MNNLGMGVMIGYLGGNEETVKAVQSSLGKLITQVELDGDRLNISFADNNVLQIWDDGQSCCEHRYMVTDDDLSQFTDCIFTDIQLKDAPCIEEEYDVHEIQFLDIYTTKGSFQMATHNEHNGYYGGFWIVARVL